RLFPVYLWGKPLAPSQCEGNSGRGQNSPVDKPQKRPAWEPRPPRAAAEQEKENHDPHQSIIEIK
ncbi:MAG: hypothetical protein JW836_13680, partial [Deltaproteobacteria bacterium]|nr:hypothetical protein [Deltaproteobacteria bacterium]